MNINEIYTSLSRCKDINKVHFKYTEKTFMKYAYRDQIELEMKSNMLEDKKYKNDKIYKIMYKDDSDKKLLYVGKTIQTIKKRFS